MVMAAEVRTRRGFVKGKTPGYLFGMVQGEIQTKIWIIENCLRENMTWETITHATSIDQTHLQLMKDIYAGVFAETTPDVDEIKDEQEYFQNQRSLVVKVLHYHFQLSDQEQSELHESLESLEPLDEKDVLNQLIYYALVLENLDQFYTVLLRFHLKASLAKIYQE